MSVELKKGTIMDGLKQFNISSGSILYGAPVGGTSTRVDVGGMLAYFSGDVCFYANAPRITRLKLHFIDC